MKKNRRFHIRTKKNLILVSDLRFYYLLQFTSRSLRDNKEDSLYLDLCRINFALSYDVTLILI